VSSCWELGVCVPRILRRRPDIQAMSALQRSRARRAGSSADGAPPCSVRDSGAAVLSGCPRSGLASLSRCSDSRSSTSSVAT
jgi:hypothetical protein